MIEKYDENKDTSIINKKNNNGKKRNNRNTSYNNIFNKKISKINLLRGDKDKIDNKELETKLQNSLFKKKNTIKHKSMINNENIKPLLLYSYGDKTNTFYKYSNNFWKSLNRKANINNDNNNYFTDSSNKDFNINNSHFINLNLNKNNNFIQTEKKEDYLILEVTENAASALRITKNTGKSYRHV